MAGKTVSFQIGDVFDPENDLAIWISTIALAHNDLVTASRCVEEAPNEWLRFYDWRISIGHYSEIMGFLSRMRGRPAIDTFIDSAPEEVRSAYHIALQLWEQIRKVAKHVRNEAAFHYPDPKGIKAMRRALRDDELRAARGGITSESGTVGDARIHYADEVMAKMVLNASGGTEEKVAETWRALGDAVAAFMRFANVAQDEFFLRQPPGVIEFRLATDGAS